MRYLHRSRGWIGIVAGTILLAELPGCASFQGLFQPKEDVQMAVLQSELHRIAKVNAATQEKIEEIHSQVQTLEVKVDGLENTLKGLAGRPEPRPLVRATAEEPSPSRVAHKPPATKVATKPAADKPVPKPKLKKATRSAKLSPQHQYDKAYTVYTQHRYDEALALFKNFLKRYPKHDLADNAQYWLGEIYYDMEDYPNAILAFKEVVTRYAEENKAPDALLKIGYAYVALDDPVNARIFLKRVIKNYPFSDAEAKARAKLKELRNL
ncbi:MAG: tol-pal system protein YbgF [Desulfobacterales bacterium]|nr:tol-pal system protein YbgF [Desulfobacterales bacterium]